MPTELLVGVVLLLLVAAVVLWRFGKLEAAVGALLLAGAAVLSVTLRPWARPSEPLRRPGDPERDEVRRAGEAREAAVDPLRRRDGESADENVDRMVGRINKDN